MYHNSYQSGFLSILYSIGSKPLQIWDKEVKNGHIKRITDEDIQSSVLEIAGSNVSTTYITAPAERNKTLGIKLPFLVMIIKNMKKFFSFEVTILDDKNVRRRFRASNYQKATSVKPFICTMPMRLDDGWNQVQFNLSDFTKRAYGTNYVETLNVQIHANCRIRRIYFCDRLYSEEELPAEFKLMIVQKNAASSGAGSAANAHGANKALAHSSEPIVQEEPEVDEHEAAAAAEGYGEAEHAAGEADVSQDIPAVEGEAISEGQYAQENASFDEQQQQIDQQEEILAEDGNVETLEAPLVDEGEVAA